MSSDLSSDVLRTRFRRRLGLAALTGLLVGLGVAARLEATKPSENLDAAWHAPAGGPGADELFDGRAGAAPVPDDPRIPGELTEIAPLLDPNAAVLENGSLVQTLPDGRSVVYTLSPSSQGKIRDLLVRHGVPFGAVVALDPRNGELKAYVEVATDNPRLSGLARKAIAPAASVFKLVTAAALMERAGIPPSESVCFRGGAHGIRLRHLRDATDADERCETLAEALGRSSNVVFARLSDRELSVGALSKMAQSFGFERAIPFVWPVELSAARIPTDRLERARAAAGFWHTRLSPLHAALMAAGIANNGAMMRPRLVRSVRDASGRPLLTDVAPRPWIRAIRPETARALTEMMEGTVAFGTAHDAFAADRLPASLAGVPVAGKTGSLTNRGETKYQFSWFVGFAPADRPTVALAVLVVNPPAWKIKAATVARWSLGWLLDEAAAETPRTSAVTPKSASAVATRELRRARR